MTTEEMEQPTEKLPFQRKRKKRRRRKLNNSGDRRPKERLLPILSPETQRKTLIAPLNYPGPKSANSPTRRRNLNKKEIGLLSDFFGKMPEPILKSLYMGMGGQPKRISSKARLIQLVVRALNQESRLGGLVKGLHQRDRQALLILLQCGGLAHHKELIDELNLSLGGSENEWVKVMEHLSQKGLIATSEHRADKFFYLIPSLLIPFLIEVFEDELALPTFEHEEMRIIDQRSFTPPFEFSLVSLATYIDQHPPRLTQQRDIFKGHKEELDNFFEQIWDPSSDLFNFHLDFLMRHGMVELRGDRIGLNRSVMSEWLNLERESQRSLILAELDRLFPLVEWLFWALNGIGEKWISERPLQALYRRWRRGDEWRERFHSDDWSSQKKLRDSYSFASLVNCGFIELGQWGREKFYRISPRTKSILKKEEAEDFHQFYLTPSFDIVAPAGLPMDIFYKIGELSELKSCDRTNNYRINQASIELAMERGWKREDILDFLRNHSQIGIPENVEQTLRDWIGHHGDIEFHDVKLLLVHRSQIKRFESARQFKPFLIHRFAPGMYAVDVARMDELKSLMAEQGFEPSKATHKYLADSNGFNQRNHLAEMLVEANELQLDLLELAQVADTAPEKLVPLSTGPQGKKKKSNLPPRTTPKDARLLCEQAIHAGKNIKMQYITKNMERKMLQVAPERLAVTPSGNQVLVATDIKSKQRLSYNIAQIERISVI